VYAVFAALLAAKLPDPCATGFVDLALGTGVAAGVAASRSIGTRSVSELSDGGHDSGSSSGPPGCRTPARGRSRAQRQA
jgi:hypothetical protein